MIQMIEGHGAEEYTLDGAGAGEKSLREIADTKSRVSAPAGATAIAAMNMFCESMVEQAALEQVLPPITTKSRGPTQQVRATKLAPWRIKFF